jgi:transcriptional regulator with XRE-family HTH domain
MKLSISTPTELGRLIRAVRKAEHARQDDVAGAIGVSDVYLGRLENGAPGARLDKVFRVLKELGVQLEVEVRDDIAGKFNTVGQSGKKPISRPQARITRKKVSLTE